MSGFDISDIRYTEISKPDRYADIWGFSSGSDGEESALSVRDLSSVLGLGRSLEKKMATHSSILSWRIPWSYKESDVTEWLTLSLFMLIYWPIDLVGRYFWLFNFLEEFVYNWYYFFLKCLAVIWAWTFLCGKYFDYNFNVSNRIGCLFFLEWTLVICIFQGICPFFKVIEFVNIKLFVVFRIPYL